MHSSTAHEVIALRSFGTGWPKFAARLMPPKAEVRTVDSSGVKTYEQPAFRGGESAPASAGALLAGLEKAHFGNLNH